MLPTDTADVETTLDFRFLKCQKANLKMCRSVCMCVCKLLSYQILVSTNHSAGSKASLESVRSVR